MGSGGAREMSQANSPTKGGKDKMIYMSEIFSGVPTISTVARLKLTSTAMGMSCKTNYERASDVNEELSRDFSAARRTQPPGQLRILLPTGFMKLTMVLWFEDSKTVTTTTITRRAYHSVTRKSCLERESTQSYKKQGDNSLHRYRFVIVLKNSFQLIVLKI
jgi:hypothetical protein